MKANENSINQNPGFPGEIAPLDNLPDGWDLVRLGDMFVFKNGLNKAKRFFGTGTPIVNYMDVFEHSGLRADQIKGKVSLSPSEVKNFEVRQGDVFFTRTSETVDEVGVAAVMLDAPHNTVFSGFVLRARPRGVRLDHYFKQYCFVQEAIRSQIVSNATYTTRALTNGRSLSAVWIALPPRLEQQAIAKALSDVDSLLHALDALIVKKRAIKQAAMRELLTGETRLGEFTGPWQTKLVADFGEVVTGATPRTEISTFWGGRYPGLHLPTFLIAETCLYPRGRLHRKV